MPLRTLIESSLQSCLLVKRGEAWSVEGVSNRTMIELELLSSQTNPCAQAMGALKLPPTNSRFVTPAEHVRGLRAFEPGSQSSSGTVMLIRKDPLDSIRKSNKNFWQNSLVFNSDFHGAFDMVRNRAVQVL